MSLRQCEWYLFLATGSEACSWMLRRILYFYCLFYYYYFPSDSSDFLNKQRLRCPLSTLEFIRFFCYFHLNGCGQFSKFLSSTFIFFYIDLKVNDVVPWVLDLILNKHIISPNPHVRQAACIWLLSLVKKLSTHKAIKVRNMPFTNTGSLSVFLRLTLFSSLPSSSLL